MTDIFIYGLFSFWACIIAYLELQARLTKFGQQSCLTVSVVLLAILAAIRQIDPDTDTWNYIYHFNEIGGFFAHTDNPFLDSGFVFIAKLTKLFSEDSRVFLLIYALFESTLLWFFAIKFTKKPNIFIFVFFLLFYLSLFQVIIRQGVAALFLIIFVFCLLERQYLKAILNGFLAFSFHKTALVFILAASLLKIIAKNQYRILLIVIPVCLFFMVFSVSDLLYYLTLFAGGNFYLDYAQNQSTLNYWGYSALSIAIFSFLLLIRKKIIDQRDDFIFLLVLIGTVMQLALMPFGPFIERIAGYWLIFLPILFANALSSKNVSLSNRNYLFCFYGLIFTVVFWYFLFKQN